MEEKIKMNPDSLAIQKFRILYAFNVLSNSCNNKEVTIPMLFRWKNLVSYWVKSIYRIVN